MIYCILFAYCAYCMWEEGRPAFVSRSDSNLDSRGRQLLHRVIAIVRSENPQKIFFCVCVECDEEDDRLALHKSPVKGRLFCGIKILWR